MSAIKGKNSRGELRVRKFLHRAGFRYRLHESGLPGKPDIVLPRFNAVVFVHGCFWHQHRGCKEGRLPKSNVRFWRTKLDGNVRRDFRNVRRLRRQGLRVFIVWECDLSEARLSRLAAALRRPLSS